MNGTIAIVGIVLAVAALAVLALSNRRPAEVAATSLDGKVIAQLRRAGSDLSQPHDIDFFLYFPTEQAARAAALALDGRGFAVETGKAAQGPKWLMQLTRRMHPVERDLVALRRELDALAARHGGEYDGWGSPVVPSVRP